MRISDLHPGTQFSCEVLLPLVGAPATRVNFTFRYRDKSALVLLVESMKDKSELEILQDVLVGWKLEDEFTPAAIESLINHIPEAPLAIFTTYLRESGLGSLSAAAAK